MELVVSRGVVRIEMILSFETREIGFAYIDVEIDMKHEELYRVEWLKVFFRFYRERIGHACPSCIVLY